METISLTKQQVEQVIINYFQSIESMDLSKYLSHFSNPVYVREGDSHIMRNHDDLTVFFQKNLSLFQSISIYPTHVFVIEKEAAVKWIFRGLAKSGRHINFEGIDFIKINDNQKIESLKAYWYIDSMLEQLA